MRVTILLLVALTLSPQDAQLKQARTEYANLIRELHNATAELKASLEVEAGLYDKEMARNKERLSKTEQLYEANLVTKRELDSDRERLAMTEQRRVAVNEQLDAVNKQLAEMKAQDPDEIARRIIKQKPKRERTPTGRVYYVRFVIVGEIEVHEYTGAVRGRVVKYRNQVKLDSRRQ